MHKDEAPFGGMFTKPTHEDRASFKHQGAVITVAAKWGYPHCGPYMGQKVYTQQYRLSFFTGGSIGSLDQITQCVDYADREEASGSFNWVLKFLEKIEAGEEASRVIDLLVEAQYQHSGFDLEPLKWFYKTHKGVYELGEEGLKEATRLYTEREVEL